MAQTETLRPLSGDPPRTHAELWKGIDPTAEPLDVEVLHEWEEDDVVLQVLRYRIGIFKGTKAMMAAVYGYPKGKTNLPGLVNIHGGGQYADYRAPLTNARRGYATITLAWAGRISAPNYRVSPKEVQLFWDDAKDDPLYRVTTDWGALDAYHAPSRNGRDAFVSIRDGSEDWTYDDIASPRNNSWFLITLGARRALTFLQQCPEVDGDRLGVYGHSMGGKLSVLTAGCDDRVKAAAPSCGGISDRYNSQPLHREVVGDSPSLKNVNCPIVFLSPANDFHGHINDLAIATSEVQSEWRVTCSPHLNHVDMPEYEVATQLWFDQYLKNEFTWPETPATELQLNKRENPVFTVTPDASRQILGVEVYYTQQGHLGGDGKFRENRINRFWHFSKPNRNGDSWTAELPLHLPNRPLWVYANVHYALKEKISGAGYYFADYGTDRFNVSSLIRIASTDELNAAGVKAELKPTNLIEDFEGDWRKDWFNRKPEEWSIRTHKIYHPKWAAPAKGKLAFDVRCAESNKMAVSIDSYGAEVDLLGNDQWQSITLAQGDFKNAEQEPLADWSGIKELRLLHAEHLRGGERGKTVLRKIGANWKGAPPEFRNLRWVKPN